MARLRWLCLLSVLSMTLSPLSASESPPHPQYIFLNRVPGRDWNQNQPDTITDALFTEPFQTIGATGEGGRRLGLSFIISYLDGPADTRETTLRRLLAQSEKHDVPVLIVLDGENWWEGRPDLWNWWDPHAPGYDPKNRSNVEWTGWGPENAVKISWRNWGRQIRVRPAPNLAAPKFREASRRQLVRLVGVLKQWRDHLPSAKRSLFPGVKIGWEASIGVNAYYYPQGNSVLEQHPTDFTQDPRTGLDMAKDFAGGLAPLGYAALAAKGWQHPGPVTLADQERVTTDYLAFLAHICRRAGLPREEIWTHAGGQFRPWPLHYSHKVALNRDSLPGWSLYGVDPADAGDLGASLAAAHQDEWCAAEWLPSAKTAAEWAGAYERTLNFRRCRFVSLYNWEGIRDNPQAVEGLRRALTRRAAPAFDTAR